MARYVYDENKVNEAIDTLNNATKKLSTQIPARRFFCFLGATEKRIVFAI